MCAGWWWLGGDLGKLLAVDVCLAWKFFFPLRLHKRFPICVPRHTLGDSSDYPRASTDANSGGEHCQFKRESYLISLSKLFSLSLARSRSSLPFAPETFSWSVATQRLGITGLQKDEENQQDIVKWGIFFTSIDVRECLVYSKLNLPDNDRPEASPRRRRQKR